MRRIRKVLSNVFLLALILLGAKGVKAQDDWTEPFPAFRIAGNLYYVGSKGLANYLITTPQGHILINSDLEANVPLIRASIESLGFKFTDVKILLISHAHWDHNAGSAMIKKLTGAKYMVMEEDVSVVESGGKTDFQYANDPTTLSMPHFGIGGGFAQGGFDFGYSLYNNCNCPLIERMQQFQFVNNWSYIHVNHTFKFGVDFRYLQNLRVPSDSHRSGEVIFQGDNTRGPNGGGLSLASFLLGEVNNFQRYVSNSLDAGERQNRQFFYGQDTWRITPKLTLNYGLRWEIYYPQTVTGARKGGWINIDTGEVMIAGVNGTPLNGFVQNSFKNFAPRLGIAYQVTPKTVVRVGYGRTFDVGTFGSIFGHSVTQNKNMSDETARQVDVEVRKIVEAGLARARQVLTDYRNELEMVAQALLEYETLTGDEVRDLIAGKPVVRAVEESARPKVTPGTRKGSLGGFIGTDEAA